MDVSLRSPSFMMMVVLLGVFTAIGNRLVAHDTSIIQPDADIELAVTFSF